MREFVTDVEDPRLADYARLTDMELRTSLESAQGLFIAEGAKVIGRAVAAGYPVRSVLLAEHEPEVAEMSARYLRRDGLRVRLVTTPERALAELTGGPDAAAVLDLTMPGLDPRRIRRALRTPVVFLVASSRGPRPRGLARSGGTTGPRRWLARPFGPRQLVAMVRDVLAGPAPASGI